MTVKLDRPSQMPAAQKRVGFEREKKRWGRNLPRLRENIVSDYVIDTDSRVEPIAFIALRKISDEKSALYGVPTMRCGHSTTVTGVNRTKSTILVDTMRREEFTECCDLWMRSYFGWILEEGIADGLELRVHTRIFRDVFENIRLLKLCGRRLRITHQCQDIKNRAVATVESLGQEAIRGSTPIAVHGVQLSPPAAPVIPHLSRGYRPKRLLIALESMPRSVRPYDLVKANIGSKSSKGRKGSMSQGWVQRRVFYYPSMSGTCIRHDILCTTRPRKLSAILEIVCISYMPSLWAARYERRLDTRLQFTNLKPT
ncbi:hypothetical protein EDD15DRAFT_2203135 [Pisolithus albus]|nr:hypothetical protein EDD15DRAFT_2203135 [Pisolithus albus]